MGDLKQALQDNQTVEKTSLIVVGSTLISVGVGLVSSGESGEWTGIAILALGVICLITRELLKLRQ